MLHLFLFFLDFVILVFWVIIFDMWLIDAHVVRLGIISESLFYAEYTFLYSDVWYFLQVLINDCNFWGNPSLMKGMQNDDKLRSLDFSSYFIIYSAYCEGRWRHNTLWIHQKKFQSSVNPLSLSCSCYPFSCILVLIIWTDCLATSAWLVAFTIHFFRHNIASWTTFVFSFVCSDMDMYAIMHAV